MVTNTVVEKIVEQQVTVVTNTVVQITPSSPEVVYVPTYNPAYVYAPPPGYVYDPYAPLVAFGAGIVVGAIIWNDCDWHHGGVYVGHHGTVVWTSGDTHHPDGGHSPPPPGNRPPPAGNRPPPGVRPQPRPDASKKVAAGPEPPACVEHAGDGRNGPHVGGARMDIGGRPSGDAAGDGQRGASFDRNVAARPSTGNVAARPATGTVAARPAPSYSGAGSSSRASGLGLPRQRLWRSRQRFQRARFQQPGLFQPFRRGQPGRKPRGRGPGRRARPLKQLSVC